MSSLSLERLKREFSGLIEDVIIEDVLSSLRTEDATRNYLQSMVDDAERAQRCPPSQTDTQTLQDVSFGWLSGSDGTVAEMMAENTNIHSQACNPTDRPPEDGGTGNAIYPGVAAQSLLMEGNGPETNSVDPFAIPGIDPESIPPEVFMEMADEYVNRGTRGSLRESRDLSGTEPSLEMKLSPETSIASCSVPVGGSVCGMATALLVEEATVTTPTGTAIVEMQCSRTSDFLSQSTTSYYEKTGTETNSILESGSAADNNVSEQPSRRDSVSSSFSSFGGSQGSLSSTAYPASDPGAGIKKTAVSNFKLSVAAPEFVPRKQQAVSTSDGSCPELYGINAASNFTRSPIASGRSTSLSPPNTSRHQGDVNYRWHMDWSSWVPQGIDALVRGSRSGATLPEAQPKFKLKKKSSSEKYGRDAEEISSLVEDGVKVMVLMRGAPGSGKTTMAGYIKGNGKIFSTDNYFISQSGRYHFDPPLLPKAHQWNQNQVERALQLGVNPVIVDNTNIKVREMEPYVKMALEYRYKVIIKVPEGVWETAEELKRRCTHGVPLDKIQARVAAYEPMTADELLEQVREYNHKGNAQRVGRKSVVTTGRITTVVQGKDLTWGEDDSTSTEPKPQRLRTISRDSQAEEDGERESRDDSEDRSQNPQESLEKDIDNIRESFKNPVLVKSPKKSPARRPRKLPPKLPPVNSDWKGLYPKLAPAPLPPRQQPAVDAGSCRKSGSQVDAGTMIEAEDYTVDRTDENLGYRVIMGRARGSIAKEPAAPEETKVRLDNNHRDNSTMTTDVSEMEYMYELLHVMNSAVSRDEIEGILRSQKDPNDFTAIVAGLYPDDDRAPTSKGAKSVSLMDRSMQIVLQRGKINENAMVENLQEGREKRQKTIVQFHRQHSNPCVEEADAFAAAPEVEAGAISRYPPTGVHPATRQRQPRPLPPKDTQMASEGAFISFPISVFHQLQEAFGRFSTRCEESTDGKEVYTWVDRRTGQELLMEMEKGMEQSLYAEGITEEERRLREAQLREDERLARKLQEEDEADERGKLRNHKRPAVSRLTGNWTQYTKGVPSMAAIMEDEKKAAEAEERQKEEIQRKKMENQSFATIGLQNTLYKMFPTLPKDLLDAHLQENEFSLEETKKVVQKIFELEPVKLEKTSGIERFERVAYTRKIFEDMHMAGKWVLTEADFKMLSSRIGELQQKRNEFAAAAIRYHRAKMSDVCFYYTSEAAKLQKEIVKEKKKVFSYKKGLCEKKIEETNMLDLHGFSKEEAVQVVQDILRSREKAYHSFGKAAHDSLQIVTGRGKHSPKGAQIKPAVINFLETNGYSYSTLNPGLILVLFENRTWS